MNELRILLVESDAGRAEELTALLSRSKHATVPVADFEEATEALYIQRFDLVLISSKDQTGLLGDFVAGLREFEARQHTKPRTAVLSCSLEAQNCLFVDGWLPLDFDPQQLADMAARFSLAGSAAAGEASQLAALDVFDPAEFEEQCAQESELMIEIIDLFCEERNRQLAEMGEAIGRSDFARLGLVAHTIKGSLGALHAPRARQRAEALETAARDGNSALCIAELDALERDLNELVERLAAFRHARSDR